jgi:hypothetical protein
MLKNSLLIKNMFSKPLKPRRPKHNFIIVINSNKIHPEHKFVAVTDV